MPQKQNGASFSEAGAERGSLPTLRHHREGECDEGGWDRCRWIRRGGAGLQRRSTSSRRRSRRRWRRGTRSTRPPRGLRRSKRLCDKFQRDNDLQYGPNNVIVSCGGKHSLYNVFQALCDPGDEVVIPAPYWVSYPEQAKLAGAKPVIIETSDQTGFAPTVAQIEAGSDAQDEDIRAELPVQPDGGDVAAGDDDIALSELAVERDFFVISDEIYEKIVYDGNVSMSIRCAEARRSRSARSRRTRCRRPTP